MGTPRHSGILRLARGTLQLALQFWPEESREWGFALASELPEIEKPLEALNWALGGLMLFTRAIASHILKWLELPAGSRLPTGSLPAATNGPILPKRSRLFTAAILLATGILFFLPQSREAVSTVRASWNGFAGSSADLRALESLGARAEREKDARTLAFVSLALPASDHATAFADRAVALDPSLVWIYASRVSRPEFAPPPPEGLARLLESDRDNAFPELIAARVIIEPRSLALFYRHTPSDQEVAALASDPAWIAHMDRALRAPHYDSYFTRHWQLTREVWNREPSLSPSVAFVSLWSHSIPDMMSIRLYGDLLVRHAHEAAAAGHPEQAESLLQELESFGRHLSDYSDTYQDTTIEKLIGLRISRQAAIELRNLYRDTGRATASVQTSERLAQIDSLNETLVHSFRNMDPSQSRALERKAILVQLSAVLAILSVLLTALSLLALELRPTKQGQLRSRLRRAICFIVDWAPVTLLAAFSALLWAFRPFAGILRSARSVASATTAWQTMHFEGLFYLQSVLGPLSDPFTAYHFWQSLICALVALALFLLVRGFLRYKHG